MTALSPAPENPRGGWGRNNANIQSLLSNERALFCLDFICSLMVSLNCECPINDKVIKEYLDVVFKSQE
jgi:hypothetical protein